MHNFPKGFFDSDTNVNCLIKFMVKNLYLGDKIFSLAKRIFDYLESNNTEISEHTMRLKYYYYNKNYEELTGEYGNIKMDEFEYVRETSSIIEAVKRLIED